mgnify:CR=1 FL=1
MDGGIAGGNLAVFDSNVAARVVGNQPASFTHQ